MGDFLLPQMGDFFTERVYFDTNVEAEWGASVWHSPILRMSAQDILAA